MSSSTAPKCEWLAIIPDKPDSLSKRMQVRASHLNNLKPDVDAGFWVVGGATLDKPPFPTTTTATGSQQERTTTPPPPPALEINGSVMIGYASSKEEVLEKLAKDVYATSGVWDLEKIQIMPFKSAIREPLK